MTVVHDASTETAAFTTVTPFTFDHTPVGTPRGVLLDIGQGNVSTDTITAVTYGGVAMARVAIAQDTAGEARAAYQYFLGASIPTGTQTVSITHGGLTANKWAQVSTVTAAADTEIVTFAKLEVDQANPQIALDTGATSSLRYAVISSGLASPLDLTILAGMTTGNSEDFGAHSARADRQTTASTGSFTIGWTALDDDVAMVAAAIQEISGAVTADPYPYVGGGYYPTEG